MGNTKSNLNDSKVYLGAALISLSVLMLEIGLTRIFSVMFESHFAFLLISLATLGLGLGGIYIHIKTNQKGGAKKRRIAEYLPITSGLMGFSVFIMLVFIVKVPMAHNIYLIASLAFIPFLFGGMFLATAFRIVPGQSARIYAADLIGASAGSILVVFLLNQGGIKITLMVAIVATLPACLYEFRNSASALKSYIFPLLTVALIAVLVAGYGGVHLGTIPFTKSAHKEMAHFLNHPGQDAKVIDSRWSAFGRTDLVEIADRPDEKLFFIDGTAGTAMYRYNGDPATLDKPEFNHFSGYFPFEILPADRKKKVLIIGAGAGREVLISLLGGAKEITAVEVNKDLVNLMRRYSDYNGGIYNEYPGVNVVVEEGRNYIRSTQDTYDIIMLSIPVTKTSRSPEGFALTENFLFTVESINDYLDRLNPDGQLVVVAHQEVEIFRLVMTGVAALKERGISSADAMKHIYTVGPEMFPVFVLKKTPFSPKEAVGIHQNMHDHNYSTLASFIPQIDQVTHAIPLGEEVYVQHKMLNDSLYLMSQGTIMPEALIEAANFELKAVTDNDPFFYKFEIGLPRILSFLLIFSAAAMIGGWLLKPGYLKEGRRPRSDYMFLAMFSLLGVGFMLIEIPLIQKFILFLGQPTYSVAILLFALLAGAGIGSWASGIVWISKTELKLRISLTTIGILAGFYTLILDQVFSIFLGTAFFIRILISIALLVPLGFFLGAPFPLGMRLLNELGLKEYVPRMWGVNGIGSVLGSALAIVLAISFGFSYALYLGMILYFSIVIIFQVCSLGVVAPEDDMRE